jgi:hypothetical protein
MTTTTAQPGSSVEVSSWNACYNDGDGIISLSCTVSGEGITGVGLIINTAGGETLASAYVELSGGTGSASPSIDLPPGKLQLGDQILAAVSGQANGQHYFVEKTITIEKC